MKILVSALLLVLAIYFISIERSSQYNTDVLYVDYMFLPVNLSLYYTKTEETVYIRDENSRYVYGLIDGIAFDSMVSVLEATASETIMRALMHNGKQVKVTDDNFTEWENTDTEFYGLNFNHPLN
ncbi:uncharacterized protein LOC117173357 [Belonocnema kinseyi]|uniref:uncharacterized protein LOC117173357 n=1 Tax=Belonocnema kinseyi TaxID=2817044 RepID=UPI00143CF3A1|nr:uncharacterized protein LOC117173357 [Belonocnema kinseyi]XP_033217763.1 uncharacterized protein LOC117173357 [Belonocnema kinseyi]XP_033217764.1 uncharacterized protein LOC117173357 [Belonocnema kinseyi]